jgi:hypothetical protein
MVTSVKGQAEARAESLKKRFVPISTREAVDPLMKRILYRLPPYRHAESTALLGFAQ